MLLHCKTPVKISINTSVKRSKETAVLIFILWSILHVLYAWTLFMLTAYGVGLLITFLALYLMKEGQPALLYLVPCILLTGCAIGWWRGEMRSLWEGPWVLCILSCYIWVKKYIYLIDRVRGPYWENIGPRSWQYGPSRFGEVRTRKTEGRYSPSTARANSVNKRFITRLLESEKTRTTNATSIQRAKIAKIKLIVFVGFLVRL